MGRIKDFWDETNRKVEAAGKKNESKLDALNEKLKGKSDTWFEKMEQKIAADVSKSGLELKRRKIEKEKMKENKKDIEAGHYPNMNGNDLFNVTMIAAGHLKYSIVSSDKAGFIITFQTPKHETFWDGKLSCFVLEVGLDARVTVSGSPNKSSTTRAFSPGAGKGRVVDMFSQSASNGSFIGELKKFKEEIWRQVEIYPKTGSAKPLATEVKIDLSNQIEQLKGLYESGALTAGEFAKAKKKLLDM